jgi:hypothetical protein
LKVTSIIRQIKSRRMRWAGHVARIGEERKLNKVLVGKPEGKRPLGRQWSRRENGIRMDLGEIRRRGVEWFQLAQDKLVADCGECGDDPSFSGTMELVSKHALAYQEMKEKNAKK